MVEHAIIILIHPPLKTYQLIVIRPKIIPSKLITQIIKSDLFQVLIINQRNYLSWSHTFPLQIPQLFTQPNIKSKKFQYKKNKNIFTVFLVPIISLGNFLFLDSCFDHHQYRTGLFVRHVRVDLNGLLVKLD